MEIVDIADFIDNPTKYIAIAEKQTIGIRREDGKVVVTLSGLSNEPHYLDHKPKETKHEI